jgi:thiol-disulfide isomerase/thioredoxin
MTRKSPRLMRHLSPALLLLLTAGCSVEVPQGETPAAPSPTGTGKAAGVAKDKGGDRDATPPLVTAPAKNARRESVETLLEQGRRAREAGNHSDAARFFDRAVAAEPKNREALFLAARTGEELAVKYPRPHSSRIYLGAAQVARQLREAFPDLKDEEKILVSRSIYNEACTLALSGDSAGAIRSLKEAFDAGFEDAGHVEADPELDSLRKLPEFQALQARLERDYAARLFARFKPFDFTFSLHDLDDKPITLDDFKGKVTIVDFWGTWCAPCRKEIPHLIELLDMYKEKGLRIVGICYENEEGAAARDVVRRYVKEHGVPYPCAIGDQATQSRVPEFEGYPTTLFVDREGKVRVKLTGYQSRGALVAIVERLLGDGGAKSK